LIHIFTVLPAGAVDPLSVVRSAHAAPFAVKDQFSVANAPTSAALVYVVDDDDPPTKKPPSLVPDVRADELYWYSPANAPPEDPGVCVVSPENTVFGDEM
jgi:hypothetical protein